MVELLQHLRRWLSESCAKDRGIGVVAEELDTQSRDADCVRESNSIGAGENYIARGSTFIMGGFRREGRV